MNNVKVNAKAYKAEYNIDCSVCIEDGRYCLRPFNSVFGVTVRTYGDTLSEAVANMKSWILQRDTMHRVCGEL